MVNATGSGIVTDIGNDTPVDFRINATIHDNIVASGNVFFAFSEEFSEIWGVYPGTRKIQLEGRVASGHIDGSGLVHLAGHLVERDFVRGPAFVERNVPYTMVIGPGYMEFQWCELPLFVIDTSGARVRVQ